MSDINIRVSVIAKAAQEAVKQLQKQTELATKGFGDLNKSVNTTALAFAGFAASVAKDIFRSVLNGTNAFLTGSVNLQIELEKLQTKFESLTGSAETAKDLLEELNEFSDKTPFEFPEIANAAQKLLSFGIEAKNVKDVLKNLGDISAASGANIQDLALAFGKVASSGFVTGREISQLQNNAIPILDALSKQLGVTTLSVKKLASEGKISASDFELALLRLGREGSFAFEAMEKQSTTLQGSLKQVQDATENLQKALGENLSPILKTTLQALASLINNTIVPGLTKTVMLLKNFFEFTQQSVEFQAVLVGIGSAFTAIAVRAGIAAAATIPYSAILTTLSTQWMVLQVRAVYAWVAMTGPVGLAIAGIAAASTAVFYLYKNWDTVRLKVLEAWATTKEFFGTNTEGMREQIRLLKEELAFRDKQNNTHQETKVQLSEVEQLRREQLDLNRQEKADLIDLTQKQKDLNAVKGANGKPGETGLDPAKVAENAEAVRVARLDAEAKLTDDLLAAEQARNLALAEQQALQDGIASEQNELALLQLQDGLMREREIIQLEYAKKIGDLQAYQTLKAKIEADQITRDNTIRSKTKAQEIALERATTNAKLDIIQNSASLITAATKDGSKAAFLAQKAAALAQAIVSTELAVVQALAVPPAPNLPLAGLARTAGNISIAAIVASAVKGFEDGGIVGGNSFSGDRVMARVNSGEMILNRQQQASLFSMANGNANQTGDNVIHVNVELDGEVVARSVSRQVANGLKLGEVV